MKTEYVNRIQQLSFKFAKYHYDKYLEDNKRSRINGEDIKHVVDDIYTSEKKNDLARFIRLQMKEAYGPAYNAFITENILGSIFEDDAYTKKRICMEIECFQN